MLGWRSAAIIGAAWLIAGSSARGQRLEVPDVENVTLMTRDGFVIRASYYPGGVRVGEPANTKVDGKLVTPVVLLHDYREQRGHYDGFARFLQSLGHAVLAPDLRGHGESNGGARIDHDRLTRGHFAMMLNDVIACKRFLLEQNNAGKLNIDLLCVMGSGLGASVAINWAVYDWSLPQLPTYRQGRDVKGLVLVSPAYSINGYSIKQTVASPVLRTDLLPVLVVSGLRDENHGDATRILKVLESGRVNATDASGQSVGKQTAFLLEPDTSLTGAELLNAASLRPQPAFQVAEFIELMAQNAARYPWRERRSPLANDDENKK